VKLRDGACSSRLRRAQRLLGVAAISADRARRDRGRVGRLQKESRALKQRWRRGDGLACGEEAADPRMPRQWVHSSPRPRARRVADFVRILTQHNGRVLCAAAVVVSAGESGKGGAGGGELTAMLNAGGRSWEFLRPAGDPGRGGREPRGPVGFTRNHWCARRGSLRRARCRSSRRSGHEIDFTELCDFAADVRAEPPERRGPI